MVQSNDSCSYCEEENWFFNGKITKLDLDSPLYEDWESCNNMVLSWMINSMHVDVSSSIMYCETTREMWIELQNLFSQGNGPKIYNLQKEISHISQNQMLVSEYYTKFKRLWDQLLNFEPLPECSCGAMKLQSTSHNKAYVMRFLIGLNEKYETLRSQILTYDPFPSMSKVYSLVPQEESHKNLGHGGSSSSQGDVVAMYANSKNSSGNSSWNKGNGKKERPFCTHCNVLGHTIEKCYKLHGYPPGYMPKRKNNATTNQVSSHLSSGAKNPAIASNLCPISKAQCEQLLAFLSSGSGFASGANGTHHAANVGTSTVAGGEGDSSGTFDVFSSQSQTNSLATACSALMSGTSYNFPFNPNLTHYFFCKNYQ